MLISRKRVHHSSITKRVRPPYYSQPARLIHSRHSRQAPPPTLVKLAPNKWPLKTTTVILCIFSFTSPRLKLGAPIFYTVSGGVGRVLLTVELPAMFMLVCQRAVDTVGITCLCKTVIIRIICSNIVKKLLILLEALISLKYNQEDATFSRSVYFSM